METAGDLYTLAGETAASLPEMQPDAGPVSEKPARRKTASKAAGESLSPPGQDRLQPTPSTVTPATSAPDWTSGALPTLNTAAEVRERAVELLSFLSPDLADGLPAELPFPPVDDPFTKTEEEWQAIWYGVRESAHRVYLNMRMEFRKQLSRAAAGEPNDLKPWTYWVFNGVCPADGEPVYGLTEERRVELGWNYPGPATDFSIYTETEAVS
ncbi:MAG: hypothetical protein KY468_12215 [Armatimonadetes bacterium]|nr:hypothetical protein [Armatimonadota bacterium]